MIEVRQDFVGWSQMWSFKEGTWLVYTFNKDNENSVKVANALVDAAVREEARWTIAAQASFARHKHNATIYSVLLSADRDAQNNLLPIDEDIMRQLANQKADDSAYDTTQKKGKYYRVRTAADLVGAFSAIAREAGGVLVE